MKATDLDSLWIVHDDARIRTTLCRWSGGDPAWSGSLADAAALADAAESPDVVVLGVGYDPDAALETAGRIAAAHPMARWVVIAGAPAPVDLAARLADLPVQLLGWPVPPSDFRRALAEPAPPPAGSLRDSRSRRDALVRQSARSFGDLDLPFPILRRDEPFLIRGEPGTGRLLLARVVHSLSARPTRFVHIVVDAVSGLDPISARLDALGGEPATLCVEGPDLLTRAAALELRGWIELGPPHPSVRPGSLRWIGLVGAGESSEIGSALGALEVTLPPLRERPGVAESFATAWLADWSERHDQPLRTLGDSARKLLAADAWPGNLRELEETLQRAVRRGGTGDLEASDLGWRTGAALGAPAAVPGAAKDLPQAAPHASPGPPPVTPAPAPAPAPRREGAPEEAVVARPAGIPVPALARALSHELGNPMVSLRTFLQLLPERYDDPTFRDDFRFQVERDLERVEERLHRLADFGGLGDPEGAPPAQVDVCALVEELLNARRDSINARSLLVLRELEDERPNALGHPERLRFAFAALLDGALEAAPNGADLYVACRHHPRGLGDRPAMRILVRFHTDRAVAGLAGEDPIELGPLLAKDVIEGLGGRMSFDSTEADERVLLVDLPAPA